MKRRKQVEMIESEAVSEIESLIKEMKGEGFNVFVRSLPFGINKVVALNVPTFKEAQTLVKALKLKTEIKDIEGNNILVFPDILPNSVKLDDLLYNDSELTNVGNNKRKVAEAYFDIGGEQ